MRIGLNLLHAQPGIGGVWTYIANLVSALGEYDNVNTFVVFVTNASQCLVPHKPDFEVVNVKLHTKSRPQRVFYENTVLQLLARNHQLDCMHWFANVQAIFNTVPAVVTVYDLLAFNKPGSFLSVRRIYRQWMITATARRAPVLLPMSVATGNELKQRFGADPKRILPVPAIVEQYFKPAKSEAVAHFRNKYELPEKFWLYVAHFNLHKNHCRLLEAYHLLKKNGDCPWPLVFRGDNKWAESYVASRIKQLELSADVLRLPRLDRNELPALYSAASAMVFPSLHEGSGIPVIEAMACGCPIAAADIPAVRENARDAVLYFNPLDVSAMAKAMLYLQMNEEQREGLRKKGLLNAREFKAESIVTILQEAYRLAAESSYKRRNQ